MSHQIEVFVDSDRSLEDFAHELEETLGIELRASSDGSQRSFSGAAPGIVCNVYQHSLEGGDDFPLEEFRYLLDLRGTIDYWVEREQRLYEYARFIFERLKRQGKYRILMTDDVEEKLDEFTPS